MVYKMRSMQCDLKMDSGIRSQVIWLPKKKGKEADSRTFFKLRRPHSEEQSEEIPHIRIFNTELFGADMRMWQIGEPDEEADSKNKGSLIYSR